MSAPIVTRPPLPLGGGWQLEWGTATERAVLTEAAGPGHDCTELAYLCRGERIADALAGWRSRLEHSHSVHERLN